MIERLESRRFLSASAAHATYISDHHEDMADQDYAVMLAADTAVNGPDSMQDFHRGVLDFAIKHRELIRRFGRYPHRNAMLGRQSTPEEAAFLREHGRGF